jgi:predicted small metal-binding protein
MAFELNCKDIGVKDCDWTAKGETPADVVEQAVAHLEDDHSLEMPEPETILEGKLTDQPLKSDVDESVRTVVERIQQELNIVPPDVPTDAAPAAGKVTTR